MVPVKIIQFLIVLSNRAKHEWQLQTCRFRCLFNTKTCQSIFVPRKLTSTGVVHDGTTMSIQTIFERSIIISVYFELQSTTVCFANVVGYRFLSSRFEKSNRWNVKLFVVGNATSFGHEECVFPVCEGSHLTEIVRQVSNNMLTKDVEVL